MTFIRHSRISSQTVRSDNPGFIPNPTPTNLDPHYLSLWYNLPLLPTSGPSSTVFPSQQEIGSSQLISTSVAVFWIVLPVPSSGSEPVLVRIQRRILTRILPLLPSTHPDPIPSPVSPSEGAPSVMELPLKEQGHHSFRGWSRAVG